GAGRPGLHSKRLWPPETALTPDKALGRGAGGRTAGRGLRDGLLGVRAHPGADLAGVWCALHLPVRVYIAAQLGLFISKGAVCLRPSRRGPAARLAPGGMAQDSACRQATARPDPL